MYFMFLTTFVFTGVFAPGTFMILQVYFRKKPSVFSNYIYNRISIK